MATPTNKSPQIESLLTAITGKDRRTSIVADICVMCSEEAVEFNDALSRKEYTISGMCQSCQDDVFGG